MEAMQALREKLKGQTDAVDEGAEKPVFSFLYLVLGLIITR